VINGLKAFFAFWYDFIIGDDWRVALVVVLALVVTYGVAATTAIPAWWVLPAAVAIVLPVSLRRTARPRPPTSTDDTN
jgi:hypothetical protein